MTSPAYCCEVAEAAKKATSVARIPKDRMMRSRVGRLMETNVM